LQQRQVVVRNDDIRKVTKASVDTIGDLSKTNKRESSDASTNMEPAENNLTTSQHPVNNGSSATHFAPGSRRKIDHYGWVLAKMVNLLGRQSFAIQKESRHVLLGCACQLSHLGFEFPQKLVKIVIMKFEKPT
jgi:hypothetical protein